VPLGADGKPLPQVYVIQPGSESAISFRVLDGANALRAAKNESQLTFNAELNAACATHARDMAVQNRPWHFGSDGSSALIRVQRAGYSGKLVGELISETYETELQTLANWMGQQDTRAILMDPRVLVLDEATSNLDAESEALVQEALARLMKGRTTLVIAHRLSTVRDANRIVVLAAGKIAETGTHDELMAKHGVYRRLIEHQVFTTALPA